MTTTDTRPAPLTDALRDRMADAMRVAFKQWISPDDDATNALEVGEHFAIAALAALEQADAWVVPKIPVDANPHVRPRILANGLIRRDAGDSTPAHTLQYVGQLLAAVDAADAQAKENSQ